MLRLPGLSIPPFVRRIASPPMRLQWQLTLSYMRVTILTTLSIKTVVLLIGYLFFFSSIFSKEIAQYLARQTPQMIPYLEHRPIDREALTRLLERTVQESGPWSHSGPEIVVMAGCSLFCITDPQGAVIAQIPRRSPDQGHPLALQISTSERTLLERALRKETDPTRLAERTPDERIFAAAPILKSNGELVGVALYRTTASFGPKEAVVGFQGLISPSTLGITISAGIIGIIFGATTARRLTSRLAGISQAADAWAGGDLTVTAPESGGDELSILARRLNRMARELNDLFELRKDLAAVDERHRLARELHDTVKQQVFATAMQVGAARALIESDQITGALARLAGAETLAHQTQQELNSILQELRPVRPGKGLTESLQEYLTEWERHSGIRGEFLATDIPALPEAIEVALLRITQEALANIARHSGATTARLFLHHNKESGFLTLSISDNGCGFLPDEKRSRGMGLSTMRERAEALPDGAFILHSAPGSGVRIEVRCGIREVPPQ